MVQKKVSVIVPVYNVEQYLPKCLDSLVDQTLEELEIIVVNDGSPDNCQTIIEDYATRYPDRIRAFQKENGGLSDARNFGVARAEGEYIGFVDSDDFVDLDMYEQLYNHAVKTGADVVACPMTYEYAHYSEKRSYVEYHFDANVKDNPKILQYANSMAPNKIYRRSFWQANGFVFPVGQWFEDSAVIYNVMMMANKVGCVNIPFMHYVADREGSITNSFDLRIFDIFKSMESIISFAKARGEFGVLREEIEYLCLRHLFARINSLRKCTDHAVSRRFIRMMYELLDQNFPKWRENRYLECKENSELEKQILQKIRISRRLMTLYVVYPAQMDVAISKYIAYIKRREGRKKKVKNYSEHPVWMLKQSYRKRFRKKSVRKEKARQEKAKDLNEKRKKRYYLRKNGMDVLYQMQSLLEEMGIFSFADFGTCLGLIREGKMLDHDMDLDIGVVAGPKDRERIRIALERQGYKLWRQYLYQDVPVEESYKYKKIKIDLNFYEMTEKYARTWLFYRKPGYCYENEWTRHIIQLTCSAIRDVRYMEVEGHRIALPENPERMLEEKYGPNWRVPDTDWVYWNSPAAVNLDEMGTFRTVYYAKNGKIKGRKKS